MIILAAAEIFGTKINRELEVGGASLADVKARAITVFNEEMAVRRRPGQPVGFFSLHYIQIFDPVTGRWHELKSSTQLRDYCQIYFFQKDSWNRESQGPIPSPTRPSPVPPSQRALSAAPSAANTSPYRQRQSVAASPRGQDAHLVVHPPSSHSPALRLSPLNGVASLPPPVVRGGSPARPPSPPVHYSVSPQRQVVVGGHGAAQSSQLLAALRDPRSPSVTVHGDKVAVLFMTMIGDRVNADEDAFRGLFSKTRVNIEPVQICKLYQQADSNGDGTLSSAEWERFGEQYPTMVDAMYVRLRDQITDDEQKVAIEEFKKVLAELEELCYRDKCQSNEVAREVLNVAEKAKRQAQLVQDARAKERDAKAVMEASRTETERARGTVAQRAADVAHAQETQTRKHSEYLETQRIQEECQFRVRDLASDTQAAERRLDELKNMVREQIEALRQTKEREEQGNVDLDQRTRGTEEALQLLDDAKNETQLALDRLSVSEQVCLFSVASKKRWGLRNYGTTTAPTLL